MIAGRLVAKNIQASGIWVGVDLGGNEQEAGIEVSG